MKSCTNCGNHKAIFLRYYSGEKLCGKCFLASIEKKVRSTISKYNMLDHKDRIAIALSGGKDSVSLLHIMVNIERKFPNSRICTFTIDEGIEGYRDSSLRIAEENSKILRIRHTNFSFKEFFGYTLDEILKKRFEKEIQYLGACAYCGVFRRRAVNLASKRLDVTKVATAHNLDDGLQTFLINIFHGNPYGIARVKPVSDQHHPEFVPRIKPLCEIPEREILFYAYLKGIEIQTEFCPYAGEALRNDMRDLINRLEVKSPGTKYTVLRSMEKIREALSKHIPQFSLNRCTVCEEPTSSDICQVCEMLRRIRL